MKSIIEVSETLRRNNGREETVAIELETRIRLAMLKVGHKLMFFVNDMSRPVIECDIRSFEFNGDRLGFYIEPGLELWAENIIVKKLETEIVNEMNFELLLEAHYLE